MYFFFGVFLNCTSEFRTTTYSSLLNFAVCNKSLFLYQLNQLLEQCNQKCKFLYLLIVFNLI